jgi:hypothetical protein
MAHQQLRLRTACAALLSHTACAAQLWCTALLRYKGVALWEAEWGGANTWVWGRAAAYNPCCCVCGVRECTWACCCCCCRRCCCVAVSGSSTGLRWLPRQQFSDGADGSALKRPCKACRRPGPFPWLLLLLGPERHLQGHDIPAG